MNRRPASAIQKIKAYDAVGVYVGVHRYVMGFVADEDDFGRLNGVALREHELQPVCLVLVQRVCYSVRHYKMRADDIVAHTLIHDPYVHEPLLEVVCFDKSDTGWQFVLQLSRASATVHLRGRKARMLYF